MPKLFFCTRCLRYEARCIKDSSYLDMRWKQLRQLQIMRVNGYLATIGHWEGDINLRYTILSQ